MIALLTTYFVIAYILVPGVLFRFLAGLFVKLRLFQLTRTEELTFSVQVAILPVVLANVMVWTLPVFDQYPFSYPFGNTDEYRSDYRLGLSLAVSSDPQKLLDPGNGPKTAYERSLARIWRRQMRFLCWYYVCSLAEGGIFGYLASKYGDWAQKNKIYNWIARKFLLPRISEWQLLLTDFTWPKQPKRDVIADVLCRDTLYRGKIDDYFLDNNGKLSGLFMINADRFRRDDFRIACQEAKARPLQLFGPYNETIALQEPVDAERYWRRIPGSNFYISADKILNLNIHFPAADPKNDDSLKDYLDDLVKNAGALEDFDISFDNPSLFPDEVLKPSDELPDNKPRSGPNG